VTLDRPVVRRTIQIDRRRRGYAAHRPHPEGPRQGNMIDVTTEKPLQVSTDGPFGSYVTVPVSQLEDLTRLFTSHGVEYEVDDSSISLNGEPAVIDVNFGRRVDAAVVQRILDGVR
jgi:hypothetical protein